MKSLLAWLEDRTGIGGLLHEALYENIPGGARWRYVWGSTLVFAFVTQMITGTFLWMAYSPSSQTAWESVYYIQHEMSGRLVVARCASLHGSGNDRSVGCALDAGSDLRSLSRAA